jgi:uncharacterized protein YlxW (UPF0749 family)
MMEGWDPVARATIYGALIAAVIMLFGTLGAWYFAKVFRKEDLEKQSLDAQLRGWRELSDVLRKEVNDLRRRVNELSARCMEYEAQVEQCETSNRNNLRRIAQLERRLGLHE